MSASSKAVETHLAFSLPRRSVRDRVLIPKYYDPDLKQANELAMEDFELHRLGDLLHPGSTGSRLGSWIRREHYGTGDIPYVRTSDLVNWRVRPDYKKGVSEAVYQSVQGTQDVKQGDLLFVAHGTYLVGTVAIVTPAESKMVLQDHVFRLRVNPALGISPYLILAALSTAFVRRQVRARQFSADIIDKIGERHLDILVPIPRDQTTREEVASEVQKVISLQDDARLAIDGVASLQMRMTKERAESNLGFQVARSKLVSRVLIPKYYDPRVHAALEQIQKESGERWSPLGDYVANGFLKAETGVEVGKMAYGTGDIPFIRTSDIADLELKRDARHSVSEAIFDKYEKKAGLKSGDVLLVRDGTYLVGSSAMVGAEDGRALACGGIYRLRVLAPGSLSPEALLLALNLPVVRQQLRARQFTRDVIDTLGHRLLEVLVPPLTSPRWAALGSQLGAAMQRKSEAKSAIRRCITSVEPRAPAVVAGRPSWSMR